VTKRHPLSLLPNLKAIYLHSAFAHADKLAFVLPPSGSLFKQAIELGGMHIAARRTNVYFFFRTYAIGVTLI
jgi:hypothetical protein